MPSIRGFEWQLLEVEERKILQYMQGANLSEFLARILVSRGISYDQISDFLVPSLRNMLPDPYILLDMEKAVKRTSSAIINKHPIVIYGDYDVDGATSSSLLRRYLRDIGKDSSLYIPDRLDEGYGANPDALKNLRTEGYKLCLMVDCGTNAFEALNTAKNIGLDVIIFDHHTAESKLPEAIAIVNPNRLDQELNGRTDLKYLCAAGVAYLFIIALNRHLRQNNYFKNHPEPNLLQYLDVVALGTVCDVMPLRGLNRAFVSQGLKVARKRANIGLTTLADSSDLKNGINSAYHFGFILGPRINAGGRVGQADLGSRLLYTTNNLHAQDISAKLNAFNVERQAIEQQVLLESITQVIALDLNQKSVIMVKGDGWHPGVIGIVASRLKDKFQKPALVVTNWKNELKGSGRSVSGLDMGSLMHQAVHKGLLSKGGGHGMAAGFTVFPNHYDDFYNFIEELAAPILESKINYLSIDGYVTIDSLNISFLDELNKLEPYGSAHPSPTVALKNLIPVFSAIIAEQHIRVIFEDETGKRINAMAFRSVDSPLKILLNHKSRVDVAGSVKLNSYRGYSQVQLIIEDILV